MLVYHEKGITKASLESCLKLVGDHELPSEQQVTRN